MSTSSRRSRPQPLAPSGWASPRRAALPALLAGLLLVAGCGEVPASGDLAAAPASAARPAAAASPSHAGHGAATAPKPATARAVSAPAPAQAAGAPSQAVQLRSELERLLGAHVLLADELVRARLRDDAAQAKASSDAVNRNRQQLALNVSKLAGAQAGGAFGKAWEEHIAALVEYTGAKKAKNAAAQGTARTRFAAAERQLGAALAQVVAGTVPKAGIDAAVNAHYDHLLDFVDSFAGGDYARAYTVQREGFGHMIMVADVLARGIAKAKKLPAADLDAPRRDLQSALSHLLAEHMGLMVQAMRAAHDRAPDFQAAGGAVNANSTDLGGAINALYGAAAGKQFLDIWAGHTEGLVQYAAAADDERASVLEETRKRGAEYAPKLARFLAGATEQRLPAIDLAAALTEHDGHLREQVDAYDSGDRARAEQFAATGYDHMFTLSQTLATAIGDTVASRLPQGGAATGGGGSAVG